MKRKLLLTVATISLISSVIAQKTKQITGFAITAPQKGQTGWKEVRLIDIATGDELRTIYKSNDEIDILNARTGKPIAKKAISSTPASAKKVLDLDRELDNKDVANSLQS